MNDLKNVEFLHNAILCLIDFKKYTHKIQVDFNYMFEIVTIYYFNFYIKSYNANEN